MKYEKLVKSIESYGSTHNDICMRSLGVTVDKICENVVIAPWWQPENLPALGKATYLTKLKKPMAKVWKISNKNNDFTYIKTGIGAPVLTDVLLVLGLTKCKRIVFIGSVGSLDSNIKIGDIVIPTSSVCGDGVSRYLLFNTLSNSDCFGKESYPDKQFNKQLISITNSVCQQKNVNCHLVKNFSIDTIFAQFVHLKEIIAMECKTIEMETAAAFSAALLMKIPLVALLNVSDNSMVGKSLISGRTKEELNYRSYVRNHVMSDIITQLFDKVK